MQIVSDMMACEKMHARIPVATCAGRQSKGISVGRDNGRFVYSIPYECRDCEAGRAALAGAPPKIKEEAMAVTRACGNCGRVMTIVGDGCCFVCYHAGKGLEGEEKAAALAAIKEKILSGRLKKSGGSGRRKAAPKDPAATRRKLRQMIVNNDGAAIQHFVTGAARVPEGVPVISLDFADERDRKIYDALIGQAARLRRTPEQRILWMLQNAMEQGTGLLAETSGR